MKKSILLILFLLAVQYSFAQISQSNENKKRELRFENKKIVAQKHQFKNFTIENNLPSNEVHALLKDSKGYMWISTDMGVCRYNGADFKLFTKKDGLGDNLNFQIQEDVMGRVWFRGFNQHITYFYNNRFTELEISKQMEKIFAGFFIQDFNFDKHCNLYFSVKGKSNYFKINAPLYNSIDTIYNHLNSLLITEFEKDKFLAVVGGKNKKDKKIEINSLSYNKQLINLYKLDLSELEFRTLLKCLVLGRKNYDFIGLLNHLLIHDKIKNKTNKLEFNSTLTALAYNEENNTLYYGQYNGIVGSINLTSFNIIEYANLNNPILALLNDGNELWISTQYDGLFFSANINYTTLYDDENKILTAKPITHDSIFIFTNNTSTKLVSKNYITNYGVNKVYQAGYWQHLQKEDRTKQFYFNENALENSNSKKLYAKRITNEVIRNQNTEFFSTSTSNIYTSFFKTIGIFDSNFVFIDTVNSNYRITCLKTIKNKFFVGTYGGLYYYKYKKLNPIKIRFLQSRISCIESLSDSELVIGTHSNGICIFNIYTQKINVINENKGLISNFIKDIAVDINKNIWALSNTSFTKIRYTDKLVSLYNFTDFPFKNKELKEIHFKSDKLILVAGNSMFSINNSFLNESHPNKNLIFEKIYLPVSDKELIANDKLIYLKPNENTIRFEYQLLSFTSNHFFYRYKLNSNYWNYTESPILEFYSLPEKEYILTIQGKEKGGEWSNSLYFKFAIEKPFYKKPWFVFLFISSIIALALFAINYRISKKYLLRLQTERFKKDIETAKLKALKTQMNPHFIFNAINSVQNFILKNDTLSSYNFLTNFSKLIRKYLEYSEHNYLSMKDELELIKLYLSIEKERLSFEYEIDLSSTIDENEDKIFTILLQPFLENAIWHGLSIENSNNCIKIFIAKIDNQISIEVTDNGRGRAASKKIKDLSKKIEKTSMAIDNISQRVNTLNYLYNNNLTYQIVDLYNLDNSVMGTKVIIKYNIIK